MMTGEELGWLVVVTSTIIAFAICLGVCLTLWCRKNSGVKGKMTPATLLDPVSQKNGKNTSHMTLLLPSVTKSEFGSEPRTPSSSVTPLSVQSRNHWSLGKSAPRPPVFGPRYTSISPNDSTCYRDIYLSQSGVPADSLPPKYATTHYRTPTPLYTDESLTHQWGSVVAPHEQLPLVPSTTLTYMPQPRLEGFTSSIDSGSSGSTRRKFHLDSDVEDRPPPYGMILSDSSSQSKEEYVVPRSTGRGVQSGISGRRNLVSGLGYSDPEVLNPNYDVPRILCAQDEEPFHEQQVEPSTRGRRLYRRSVTLNEASNENRKIYRRSITLNEVSNEDRKRFSGDRRRFDTISITSRESSPGTGMLQSHDAPISLSTGLKLGQIPYISSNIGSSQSREGSRNRMSLKGLRNPESEDAISGLGLENRLSPLTPPTSDDALDSSASALDSAEICSSPDTPYQYADAPMGQVNIPHEFGREAAQLQLSAADSIDTETKIGSLGGLDIQLKFHATREQLILRILSCVRLPSRYLVPGAYLYVKILIEGTNKYTTPTVVASDPAVFCSTLVHPITSQRLSRTSIRFSMCQLDTRHRRVVVGYSTLYPPSLWPILHLSADVTQNLTTRNLLLNLTDSTPEHQLHCGGNVTFGLLVSENLSTITITSVTLQQVGGKDVENCLVYVKASLYRGTELVIWKRSKPTLLNSQRTHLVHELHLQLSDDEHEDERALADFVDDESDLLIGKDEDKQQSGRRNTDRKKQDSDQNGSKTSTEGENPGFQNQSDVRDDCETESGNVAEHDIGWSIQQERQKLMLVLSVRLKTLKRGGRCVLGSVHIGEAAPTEGGRNHWGRAVAQAVTLVPAAGTHVLGHQN